MREPNWLRQIFPSNDYELPMNETLIKQDDLSFPIDRSGCRVATDHDREVGEIDLLSPLSIREVTFRNRIAMSPMCQYSAHEGFANDWHLVHLGSRAVGGVGLIMVEATAVTREGRISPGDMGIWSDEHIEPLARIARFAESQGVVPGIQIAHAGRKGSCDVPWRGGRRLEPDEGGWPVPAPSPVPFYVGDPAPVALDHAGIDGVVAAFELAAERALAAGFKVIEIHAAHGYLLHEFLSPLANYRNDLYGGSLENRMRLPLRVAEGVRSRVPPTLPVFVRISATDWLDGGWDIEQSVELCKRLNQLHVDVVDVSSGGMVPTAQIPMTKGFQVPLARRIRKEAKIRTAAVGMITEVALADQIVTEGNADLVMIGRELLREPYWALKAEAGLGAEPCWPIQYGYAVKRRAR
jgi:2,4-dienoyl-CoA reductase-like NADH-dependent reductase (Old Yellow Enzyme family)